MPILKFLRMLVLHRQGIVFACLGLVTFFLAWQIPSLSFRTSISDLIIEDQPEALEYRDYKTVFGSDDIIRLVVKTGNVFDPATFTTLDEISRALADIDGVKRVISLPLIKNDVDRSDKWSPAEFAAIIEPVDLFTRNLISGNHKTTALTLLLTTQAEHTAVIAAVQAVIQKHKDTFDMYQIGMPLVSEAMAEYTRDDFFHLPPYTIVLISILLIVFFKNPRSLAAPIGTVILTLVWTLGGMAWFRIPLSMLTMTVPVFLIAVGTAYCLYVISEYQSNAANAGTRGEAVCRTYDKIGFPVILAGMTTLVGIGSLMVNRITAIREFSVVTCMGIVSLMVIVFTFFPSLLSVLPLPERVSKKPPVKKETWVDKLINLLIHLNLHHQKKVFIVLGGVTLFCLAGIFFIQVETNPMEFFKPDTRISKDFHDIYQDLSGSFPVHVVVDGHTEDFFEDVDHVRNVETFQSTLARLPGVDKTISLADYLKLVNFAQNRYETEYYRLPEDIIELKMLINQFKIMLGSDMLFRFLSRDYAKTNIVLLTHISSSRDFLALKKRILDNAGEILTDGVSMTVTGVGTTVSASSHLLTAGQIKSLSISLVLIFMMMMVLFLSGKVGLIALVPNCFPIIVNFGLMGWLGIELSVATSLIACIAIGLAVDDTIHYLVKYNAEFKKGLDKDKALRETLLSVGRPIIFTTIIIGTGFSILMFSHFQPTSVFGLLMVITMCSALVGDLILLPCLMRHVELVTAWDLLKLMPTIGGMSQGAAHELNQPLNAIKMGSEFLKAVVAKGAGIDDRQLFQVSREISSQVDRAARIVSRLSDLEPQDMGKEDLAVNPLIHRVLSILENQLKLDCITIDLALADDLPVIHANVNRFTQMIYNLVVNAIEAINVEDTDISSPRDRRISISSHRENYRVIVIVSDTGVGIPKQHKDRIFEPFFTTKTSGKGKGLGLTISRQIVKDCHGQISIKKEGTNGCAIILSFPAALAADAGMLN